ncbi:MAG: hypothetical protein IJA48_05390 [Oscillospiraceae bacterium]|nr:hypothetical protein [Oscillospiraceae bacterium]
MEEYKESYLILFRAVRDAIQELEAQNYGKAKERLIQGEQKAEEAYLHPEKSAKIS